MPFIKELKIDKERSKELLQKGHILATEVADQLTASGVPFREAYQKVTELVKEAQTDGVQIHQARSLKTKDNITMDFVKAVEKRQAPGGTALARVKERSSELHSQDLP